MKTAHVAPTCLETGQFPTLPACGKLEASTAPAASSFHFVVPLNVGGHHYTSTLPVLRRYEESMLAAMFSGRHLVVKDKDDRYFIDREGENFGHILNFLRGSKLPPLHKVKEVYEEALYYGIKPLADSLRRYRPILEAEQVAKWPEEFPASLSKAEEIAELLQKKFADTLKRESRVVIQFDQEASWDSVHHTYKTGKSIGNYYVPYDFQQDESHEKHECPLPEVSMGEMTESEREKTMSFFGHFFEKLGYKMEVVPGECRESVWSERVTAKILGDGLDNITVYCNKKVYTLIFT